MEKLWSFLKNEDGTLSITGYKGTDLEIIVPAVIDGKRVTAIDNQAFCSDKSGRLKKYRAVLAELRKVEISDGITVIGESAFAGCSKLSEVVLPESIEAIGKNAFLGCEGLKDINLPASLKAIGEWAFYGCKGLTSVCIPDGMSSIEGYVFCECANLSSVTPFRRPTNPRYDPQRCVQEL